MSLAAYLGAAKDMQIEIFTIFPDMLGDFLKQAILGKAIQEEKLKVKVTDLRSGASDSRSSVDDSPFGGGPGMVLAPEPVFSAVEQSNPVRPLFLLSPAGRQLNQDLLQELSELNGFSLLCGRYEGVDERIRDSLADGEISLGDFVLQGGEVAAMAIVEGVSRLIKGTLGNPDSTADESFSDRLLEYPQYTRPEKFRNMNVPEILLSGNHQKIALWRKAQALSRTLKNRPDLIQLRGGLSPEEEGLLENFGLL